MVWVALTIRIPGLGRLRRYRAYSAALKKRARRRRRAARVAQDKLTMEKYGAAGPLPWKFPVDSLSSTVVIPHVMSGSGGEWVVRGDADAYTHIRLVKTDES